MSLSQPQNQIRTWFVLFHTASSATLLQLLQRDLLQLSYRHDWHDLTYMTVQIELKQTSCGNEVTQKGIFCYDASADPCIWSVQGICCRGKEDCCHVSVHGLQDFLYFWKLSHSDCICLGSLLFMNTSLAQGFSCVQITFCMSHT